MKNILLVSFIIGELFFYSWAQADTIFINGYITQNTNFADPDNIYVLNNDLYIASGATLTLASGVELQTNLHSIYIDGRLESMGGILHHIGRRDYGYGYICVRASGQLAITGGTVRGAGTIEVQNAAQAEFSEVAFEYYDGGASYRAGSPNIIFTSDSMGMVSECAGSWQLTVSSSQVTVADCTIPYLQLNDGAPTVTGNTFSDAYPIRLANPALDTSGITGNTYTHTSPWIYLQGATMAASRILTGIDGLYYQMQGNLTIASGATLTLATGVELQTNSYSLSVDGHLESMGGILHHIMRRDYNGSYICVRASGQLAITGGTVRGAGTIEVQNAAQAEFSEVAFEYYDGGASYRAGSPNIIFTSDSMGMVSECAGSWQLTVSSSQVTVADCTIPYLQLNDGAPTVTGNTFSDAYPIRLANPALDTSNITGNFYLDPAPIINIKGVISQSVILSGIDGLTHYILNGHLTIPQNVKLVIYPGVTISTNGWHLYLDGIANLYGTNFIIHRNTRVYVRNGATINVSGGTASGPGVIEVQDGGSASFATVKFYNREGDYYWGGKPSLVYQSGATGSLHWCQLSNLSIHSDAQVAVTNNDISNGYVTLSGSSSAIIAVGQNWWGDNES